MVHCMGGWSVTTLVSSSLSFFVFVPVRSLLPTFQLDRKKKEGTYKTKKQKEQEARAEAAKAAMLAAGLEGKLY